MARDGELSGWVVRIRTERKTRGWDVPMMARRLRAALGDGDSLPPQESLVRVIRRWESGETTTLSERYRLLYSRALGIPEAILFAPARTLSPYDGTTDNQQQDHCTGHEGEGDPTNRRDVLRVGLAAAMGRVLGDAAEEAMEFTRRASQSAVGQGTLDHLEVVITDIATNVNRNSPADMLVVAHAYRQRVDQLIRSPHTLREGRELYVYAGWLSHELSWLAHELGNPVAAHAYAIDAFEHAHQAGHDELYAHAANVMASISIQGIHPDRALSAAQKGLSRVPARHILAIRLNTQAARAHAQLGQRAECESLLQAAETVYERLPGRLPGSFGTDAGASGAAQTIPSYSALAWLSLGDFEKSRRHSETAIAAYEAKPAENRVPSSEALTRIYLGIALAQLGAPEEAVSMGLQGLESPRLTAPIHSRAAHLDRILTKRYPGLSDAEEFHERRLALTT